MLCALQDGVFSECVCDFILGHNYFLLQNLDCNKLSGLLVPCKHNLAKGTLAKNLHHLEVVQRQLIGL